MQLTHSTTARALHSSYRGFTLIELLLVLVILGILAAIVVPKFSGRTEQARQTAAVSQIATFGTALDAFEVAVVAGEELEVPQDAPHHDDNPGAGALPHGPIDSNALADVGYQLGGDDFKFVDAHCLDGAIVQRQGVVKRDLVVVKS
jgi:prepilin-type N-terminal cleavage/methylation domain-containing protein